jgi:hypothetical protein
MLRTRLAFATLLLLSGCSEKIIIRNGADVPVDVTIDQKHVARVDPNQVVRVDAPSGAVPLSAAGDGFSETETLNIPSSGCGDARMALYNVGGKDDLLLVAAGYGADKSRVKQITAKVTVFEPNEKLVSQYINETIPGRKTGPSGGFTTYYLCTRDEKGMPNCKVD